VFIGRPVLWGLAHSGEEGVCGVLQLLNDELVLAMKLAGAVTVGVSSVRAVTLLQVCQTGVPWID
jgi:isopentenyl diphosphate isomerase/L-lactate dehydrogenase-like FMN-dependent dehydrogenase